MLIADIERNKMPINWATKKNVSLISSFRIIFESGP